MLFNPLKYKSLVFGENFEALDANGRLEELFDDRNLLLIELVGTKTAF